MNSRRGFDVATGVEPVPSTRSYMFTGPDGIQYRWALGACGMSYPKVGVFFASLPSQELNCVMKLVTTDEKKTVIAEFYHAHHSRRKEKPRLEVQPAGMDMLDDIILTFVFADSKRRERETRLRAAGAAGAAGGGG